LLRLLAMLRLPALLVLGMVVAERHRAFMPVSPLSGLLPCTPRAGELEVMRSGCSSSLC
jgi:hypothetical protein